MNKRTLLLGMIIVLIFLGGMFTGIFYTNHTKDTHKIINSDPLQKSAVKPNTKDMPKVNPSQSKVLIGYVQDFRDPNVVDYDKLTHVIFSFAHPTTDGGILLNGDSALKNLRTIAATAKKHHTKVILGVGGWYHIKGGESYPYFKAAISKPDTRTKLVNELVRFVDREHLDGVDIDFEHPHSTADSEYLAAFVKELSDKLHPKQKELSVAVYAKIHAVTLTETNFVNYDSSMFQHVDHVNIMAYDGQWDDGYHAENLSPYPYAEKIVNYWSRYFDENGISKEKLVLGVPFYAQPVNPNIKQVSFDTIVKANPANAEKDSVNLNGTTYYYNGDAMMVKKTKLAMDHGFGGMMLWEAGHDTKGPKSLTGAIYKTLADAQKGPVKYYSVK
ncbi:glycoside hydrolase family 18 protein [Bacillus sp. JJ1764]|uniref:glycoside hydrolase family 18 protein n=1 Tax=Bacillus sp. JJ1764 TaxID=3122964 RepID=UPI002FFF8CCA